MRAVLIAKCAERETGEAEKKDQKRIQHKKEINFVVWDWEANEQQWKMNIQCKHTDRHIARICSHNG